MKKGLVVVASLLVLILVIGCAEKMTEEQLYAKVLDYEEKQQWEDLADTYEQIVKQYPDSPKAADHLYNLGMVYANNLKEYEKAIDMWQRLLKEHGDSDIATKTEFLIGYCYANNIKDYDMARQKYSEFLEKNPDHVLAPSVQWELEHLGQDIDSMTFEVEDETATN